jgi:hypothetical protein
MRAEAVQERGGGVGGFSQVGLGFLQERGEGWRVRREREG